MSILTIKSLIFAHENWWKIGKIEGKSWTIWIFTCWNRSYVAVCGHIGDDSGDHVVVGGAPWLQETDDWVHTAVAFTCLFLSLLVGESGVCVVVFGRVLCLYLCCRCHTLLGWVCIRIWYVILGSLIQSIRITPIIIFLQNGGNPAGSLLRGS